jgi:hypothetical protein
MSSLLEILNTNNSGVLAGHFSASHSFNEILAFSTKEVNNTFIDANLSCGMDPLGYLKFPVNSCFTLSKAGIVIAERSLPNTLQVETEDKKIAIFLSFFTPDQIFGTFIAVN